VSDELREAGGADDAAGTEPDAARVGPTHDADGSGEHEADAA
jgi:hypothetical protein